MTKELLDAPISEPPPRSSTESKTSQISEPENAQNQIPAMPEIVPEITASEQPSEVQDTRYPMPASSASPTPPETLPHLQTLPSRQSSLASSPASSLPSPAQQQLLSDNDSPTMVMATRNEEEEELASCNTPMTIPGSSLTTPGTEEMRHDYIDWPETPPSARSNDSRGQFVSRQDDRGGQRSLPTLHQSLHEDQRLASSMLTLADGDRVRRDRSASVYTSEQARERKARMDAATQAAFSAARASRALTASSFSSKISEPEGHAQQVQSQTQESDDAKDLVEESCDNAAAKPEHCLPSLLLETENFKEINVVTHDSEVSVPKTQSNNADRNFVPQREIEDDTSSLGAPSIGSLELRSSIRRMNGIRELMDTEEQYGKDLETLCQGFLVHIRDADFISQSDKDMLIRNAFDILDFQDEFATALLEAHGEEESMHNGIVYKGDLRRIALCFQEWAPRFAIYIPYCVHQDQAMKVYNRLMDERSPFLELVDRMHQSSRASSDLDRRHLDDYFIMPFQRFFRYRLILQSISKATEKHTAEHEELNKALDAMHAIGNQLNTEKAWMEAERKTALFLARLESDWTIPRRWHASLGRCVLIGTLDVRSRQKIRRHGCALFNGFMIVAKAKRYKHTYDPRFWFPMRTMRFENLTELDTRMPYAWRLHHEKMVLEFSAICEQEKQVWIEAIQRTIGNSKAQFEERGEAPDVIEQLFVPSYEQQTRRSLAAMRASPSLMNIYYPRKDQGSELTQTTTNLPKSSTVGSQLHRPIHSLEVPGKLDANTLSTPKQQRPPPTLGPRLPRSAPSTSLQSSCHSTDEPQSQIPQSPYLHSVSSVNDMREMFSTAVLPQTRAGQQSNAQCRMVDSKFEDVCTTPILTARSQAARQGRRSYQMSKTSSMLSFNTTHTDDISYFALSPSSTILSSPVQRQDRLSGAFQASPSRYLTFGDMLRNAVRRRPSLPTHRSRRLVMEDVDGEAADFSGSQLLSEHDRRRSLGMSMINTMIYRLSQGESRPVSSTYSRDMPLPPPPGNKKPFGLTRGSSKFFGKMVEKLGHIGTPSRTRRSRNDHAAKPPMMTSSHPYDEEISNPSMTPPDLQSMLNLHHSNDPVLDLRSSSSMELEAIKVQQ